MFPALVAVGLFFPVVVSFGVTALAYARYRALGVERQTWLFAIPSFVLAPLVGIAGLVRPTFVWSGRRYR